MPAPVMFILACLEAKRLDESKVRKEDMVGIQNALEGSLPYTEAAPRKLLWDKTAKRDDQLIDLGVKIALKTRFRAYPH